MRWTVIVLSALICASCGGASNGGSSADPPSATPASSGASPVAAQPAPPPPPAAPAPASPVPPDPSAPVTYSLVDLGTLGGDVIPHGINDHDDVVGSARVPGQAGVWHAFLYLRNCSCIQDLALSVQESSDAWAVDDSDDIAMDSQPSSGAPPGPAILWRNGSRIVLPSTNPDLNQNGAAYALNSSGMIVGTSWSKAASAHATLWMPHGGGYTATDMGTFGGAYSRAMAVNDKGDAVGISDTPSMGGSCNTGADESRDQAFLFSHGHLHNLGTLSKAMDDAQATGINSSGEVVGSSEFGDCGSNPHALSHAFLWQNGHMHDLGTLAAPNVASGADAINDGGEIVGFSQIDSQGDEHAFLYIGGRMLDLNALIAPGDPLRAYVMLWEATAINCAGDIAAWGRDSRDSSRKHGYLLLQQGPAPHGCGP